MSKSVSFLWGGLTASGRTCYWRENGKPGVWIGLVWDGYFPGYLQAGSLNPDIMTLCFDLWLSFLSRLHFPLLHLHGRSPLPFPFRNKFWSLIVGACFTHVLLCYPLPFMIVWYLSFHLLPTFHLLPPFYPPKAYHTKLWLADFWGKEPPFSYLYLIIEVYEKKNFTFGSMRDAEKRGVNIVFYIYLFITSVCLFLFNFIFISSWGNGDLRNFFTFLLSHY